MIPSPEPPDDRPELLPLCPKRGVIGTRFPFLLHSAMIPTLVTSPRVSPSVPRHSEKEVF